MGKSKQVPKQNSLAKKAPAAKKPPKDSAKK